VTHHNESAERKLQRAERSWSWRIAIRTWDPGWCWDRTPVSSHISYLMRPASASDSATTKGYCDWLAYWLGGQSSARRVSQTGKRRARSDAPYLHW